MAKNVNRVSDPQIEYRPEKQYMGIRIRTPFKGMFSQVDKLSRELNGWFAEREIEPAGPPFLRYHVIDMNGEMDIAYCIPVKNPVHGDDRVTADTLPAGRYAYVIYMGSGMQGNKALLYWIRDNNILMDKQETEKGDVFGGRCETYLTDPKVEHRKTRWEVDLAIRLKDEE